MAKSEYRLKEAPRLPVRFLQSGDQVVLVRMKGPGPGPGRPGYARGVVVRVWIEAGRALVQVIGSQKRVVVQQGEFDAIAGPMDMPEKQVICDALEDWGEALARKGVRSGKCGVMNDE